MIRSMTGFGAGRAAEGAEAISVEAKSVNHKFCEVKARLPRELAALEGEVGRLVKARLARGAVEVFVRREGAAGGLVPQVNAALAQAWVAALRELGRSLGVAGDVALVDLARVEGVVKIAEQPPDLELAGRALALALGNALTALEVMRAKEGAALAADLAARLDAIERASVEAKVLVPQSVEAYRDRLAARVAELSRGVPVEPARLAQEVAIFADKSDVAEELTRLASHLVQARGLLDAPQPVGRSLEFVVQEMNREVNTLGSKSQSAGIAALIVTMKTELERIREQIQNVE